MENEIGSIEGGPMSLVMKVMDTNGEHMFSMAAAYAQPVKDHLAEGGRCFWNDERGTLRFEDG